MRTEIFKLFYEAWGNLSKSDITGLADPWDILWHVVYTLPAVHIWASILTFLVTCTLHAEKYTNLKGRT